MLWQLAYAELYFLDKLWPDFLPKDLLKVIKNYNKTNGCIAVSKKDLKEILRKINKKTIINIG